MSGKRKRTVHIDGAEWTYMVGRDFIHIWAPDGTKYVTDESKVTGWTWDDLERAYWKKYAKGVGPGLIKQWIQNNLL